MCPLCPPLDLPPLRYAMSSLMPLGVHRKVRIKSRVQWAVAGQQSKFLCLLYVT